MKYFLKQYWRYIAMALAFATFNFLINACQVHAQTYTYYLNDTKANLYFNNQLQSSVSYNSVNDNVWSYNFSATWGNNIRLVNQNALNLGHGDIVLFNMRFHYTIGDTQTFSNINSVGFSDEACFYGVTNQAGANNSSRDTYITAICFLDQDMNFASGSNIANVSFDWSSINYFNISNITVVDNKDTARELKTKIDTLTGKIDTTNTHLIDINTNLTWLNQTLLREEVLLQIIKTNTDNIYTYVQWIDGLLETISGQNNTINNNIQSQTQQQHQDSQAINDSINNSNTEGGQTQANDFFNNFDGGQTGSLMDLVSLPLDFLDSLNNSCSPINITIPFFNQSFQLPCLRSTLTSAFGGVVSIIVLVINAVLCYRLIKGFIDILHNLKDPNNDEIEVMDL